MLAPEAIAIQVSGHLRSSNMLRVVLTLATWLLLAHWAACLFYGLGFYTVCVFEWYTNSWVLFYWQGIVSRTTFCESLVNPSTSGSATPSTRGSG